MSSTSRLSWRLMVAALLVTGCLSSSAPTRGPATRETFQWGAPVVVVSKCLFSPCYEATIAADTLGRIFTSDGRTSDLGISTDGGATFAPAKPPPIPQGLPGSQTNVILQVSPAGRLYYTAMVLDQENYLAFVGIQVAWSDDGGASWAGNVLLTPATSPGAIVLEPDRPWLGFGEGKVMALTYNQAQTGIWFARSDDAGATWGSWVRAIPYEERMHPGGAGPPIVTPGHILVPACNGDLSATDVYMSEDHGASFHRASIRAGYAWFPFVTRSAAGELVLAVTGPSSDLLIATSRDDGVTWSSPAKWGTNSTSGPSILPGKDRSLDLAWYSGRGLPC